MSAVLDCCPLLLDLQSRVVGCQANGGVAGPVVGGWWVVAGRADAAVSKARRQ